MFSLTILFLFASTPIVLLKPIENGDNALTYLTRLGYNRDQCNSTSDTKCLLDMSTALHLYQKTFRLNQTGRLDAATKTFMNKPRCGNPDIRQPTGVLKSTSMVTNPRWTKPHLTWVVRSFPSQMSSEKTIQVIEQAFQVWKKHIPLDFERVCAQCNADFVFDFARDDHGDNNPFDGEGVLLAHAYFPEDGRVHFDLAEKWIETFDNSGYSLFLVAVHEIGHALGLHHNTDDKDSIMFPIYQLLAEDRLLTENDRQLITNMYGERDDPTTVRNDFNHGKTIFENSTAILRSDNGQYELFMQLDGNLCLYRKAGNPVWCSETYNHVLRGRPHRIEMQSDGNLVVSSAKGPLWSTGLEPRESGAPYELEVRDDGILIIYDKDRASIWTSMQSKRKDPVHNYLGDGASGVESKSAVLRSKNRRYELFMQMDGNLCIYRVPAHPTWCTGTYTHPSRLNPHRVVMQSDGNLVVYSQKIPLWATHTQGQGGGSPNQLELQDDGILVVYDKNRRALWNSKKGRLSH